VPPVIVNVSTMRRTFGVSVGVELPAWVPTIVSPLAATNSKVPVAVGAVTTCGMVKAN